MSIFSILSHASKLIKAGREPRKYSIDELKALVNHHKTTAARTDEKVNTAVNSIIRHIDRCRL